MREIKFRALDKKTNKILTELDLFKCGFYLDPSSGKFVAYGSKEDGSEGWGENDNLIPIEFTGLKDKNGKEIYEGDVIKDLTYSEHYIGTVEFINSTMGLEGYHLCGFGFYSYGDRKCDPTGLHENVEVIGNIYENPELLKLENKK